MIKGVVTAARIEKFPRAVDGSQRSLVLNPRWPPRDRHGHWQAASGKRQAASGKRQRASGYASHVSLCDEGLHPLVARQRTPHCIAMHSYANPELHRVAFAFDLQPNWGFL